MAARLDGVTRIPLLLAIGLLAGFAVTPWHRTADAQCSTCGCQDACECPVPNPRLENSPGTSLFWHDNCGGGYESCFRRFYCHESCRPTWYVDFEFVPLYRSVNNSLPMQSQGPAYIREFTDVSAAADPADWEAVGLPVPDIALGTGSFDAEFDPGAKIVIGRTLGDWYRIEAAWKGSYSWSDSVTVRDGDSDLWSPFSNFGNPLGLEGEDYGTYDDPDLNATGYVGLDANELATIGFTSSLNDVEMNLRRRLRMKRTGALKERRYGMGESSFLVGLRYMGIEEQFYYITESVDAITNTTVDTSNNLFGVQLGYMAQILVHDRGWIDVEAKGAILFNDVGQETTFANTTYPRPYTYGGDEIRTAFLGDFSVVFNYQIARSWTFRAGYNGLWLSGVALAAENFNNDIDTLESGPANVRHNGDVVYHGPQVGFVWTR